MSLKHLTDNPYLAPVVTPLKWIGKSLAFMMGPYIRAAKDKGSLEPSGNRIIDYFDRLDRQSSLLTVAPMVLGGMAGLVGAIGPCFSLLAGTAAAVKIAGGIAITSAIVASSALLAPVALAVAIAGMTLVATAGVATVPGIIVGLKQTLEHACGWGKRVSGPAAVTAVSPPTTIQQLSAHLSGMSEAAQQQILNQLRNKPSNDFVCRAAPVAAPGQRNIVITKPIKLKKASP